MRVPSRASRMNVEAEAAETQTWLEFAAACGYLERDLGSNLQKTYDGILATLVGMINHSDTWVISEKR